jgi:hypothetical protein
MTPVRIALLAAAIAASMLGGRRHWQRAVLGPAGHRADQQLRRKPEPSVWP